MHQPGAVHRRVAGAEYHLFAKLHPFVLLQDPVTIYVKLGCQILILRADDPIAIDVVRGVWQAGLGVPRVKFCRSFVQWPHDPAVSVRVLIWSPIGRVRIP